MGIVVMMNNKMCVRREKEDGVFDTFILKF